MAYLPAASALGARNDDFGADLTAHVRPLVVLLHRVGCIVWLTECQEGKALVLATVTHRELDVLKLAVFSKVVAEVVLGRLVGETAEEDLAPLLIRIR